MVSSAADMRSDWGALQGVAWFFSVAVKVKSFSHAFWPFDVLGKFHSWPLPPSLWEVSGKLSLFHCFFSVTVPGGGRPQGCHGYPTCSALVLVTPPSFQAPSPSSPIFDEFNGELNVFSHAVKQAVCSTL